MGRILIVDDDPAICEVLTEVLGDAGHYPATATDGQAALERVRASAPDLILMDLMLPTLDGVEATRRLKQDPATRHIPIIAMSAGRHLESMADELPANDVLAKPFDIDVLLAAVALYLPPPALVAGDASGSPRWLG
jgi:CheY-like chemotaxis protein